MIQKESPPRPSPSHKIPTRENSHNRKKTTPYRLRNPRKGMFFFWKKNKKNISKDISTELSRKTLLFRLGEENNLILDEGG